MTRRDYSDDAFPVALRKIMDERGLTVRPLLEKAGQFRGGEKAGKTFTTGYYSLIMSGQNRATPDAIQAFAAALGIDPTYFKEYRQFAAATRARELEQEIGLAEVLRRLEAK